MVPVVESEVSNCIIQVPDASSPQLCTVINVQSVAPLNVSNRLGRSRRLLVPDGDTSII